MRLRKHAIIFLLILSAFFIASCIEKKSAKEGVSQETSAESQSLSKAPVFQGKNLVDGKDISMEDMKEYVLIIDFWASWCPPCREEIPGFIELHDKYKDKKFAVVGISVDRSEQDATNFVTAQKVNYPVLMATKQTLSDYEKAIGQPIRGIPTTLIVNRRGEIVSVHVGFRTKDVFEKEIQKLL